MNKHAQELKTKILCNASKCCPINWLAKIGLLYNRKIFCNERPLENMLEERIFYSVCHEDFLITLQAWEPQMLFSILISHKAYQYIKTRTHIISSNLHPSPQYPQPKPLMTFRNKPSSQKVEATLGLRRNLTWLFQRPKLLIFYSSSGWRMENIS